MALIKCKECDNEVSNKAESCPKCGAKIKTTSLFIQILGGFVVLLVLVAIFAPDSPDTTSNTDNSGANNVAEAAPADEFSTTANQIALEYDANTVAADAIYKGKRFQITGTVAEISTDFMDNAVVQMKGGVNEFLEPQFKLADAEKSKAASLAKGVSITMSCVGNGDIAKTPMLDDCYIQ